MTAIKTTSAAALQAYTEQFSTELFNRAYWGFDAATEALILEGVKGRITLTDLEISENIWKRASGDFTPTPNIVNYVPRTLSVVAADADILIEPYKLASSYLDVMKKAGQNVGDIPFEGQVMAGLVIAMSKQMSKTFWQGKETANPQPTDLLNLLFDGYIELCKKARTQGASVVPVPGGAYTKSNVLAHFNSMFEPLGAEAIQNGVVSYSNRKIMTLYHQALSEDNKYFRPEVKRNKAGVIEAVEMKDGIGWLIAKNDYGTSNLVSMTQRNNIVWATDQLADQTAEFEIKEQIKKVKQMSVRAMFGMNLRCVDADYMSINDLN